MLTTEEDSGKGQPSGSAARPSLHCLLLSVSVPPGRGVTREVLHTKVSATNSSEVSCQAHDLPGSMTPPRSNFRSKQLNISKWMNNHLSRSGGSVGEQSGLKDSSRVF